MRISDTSRPVIFAILVLFGGCGRSEPFSGTVEIEGFTQPREIEGDFLPEFRYLARLGSLDGPDLLEDSPGDVVLDSLGRVFVIVSNGGTTPAVFDTLGNYLGRLGRLGEGPGEFRWPWAVEVAPDGSVLVYDSDLSRVSVFDPDLGFQHSYPWKAEPASWLLLSDGSFIANSVLLTRTPGTIFQVVKGGIPLESFGQSERGRFRTRSLALASRGGFWAAHNLRYQIDHWSVEGVLLDSLVIDVDWFPGGEEMILGGRNRAPNPVVQDVREDDLGRLWVVLWRPREDWQEAWPDVSNRDGTEEVRRPELPPYSDLFFTQIDVFDPETHELIFTLQWDELAHRFAGDGLLATRTQDRLGADYIDLWRVHLQQASGF